MFDVLSSLFDIFFCCPPVESGALGYRLNGSVTLVEQVAIAGYKALGVQAALGDALL